MELEEEMLRGELKTFGYRLVRNKVGYQIRDRETESVYLGETQPVSLDQVRAFVDDLDEYGVPDLCGEDLEDEPPEELIGLDMEVTALIRHRETLRQEGRLDKAASLDAAIEELEDASEDSAKEYELLTKVFAFLRGLGYRVETKSGYYRVTQKATDTIVLGKAFDADPGDLKAFAEKLGLTPCGAGRSNT